MGFSALHYAVRDRHVELTRYLLAHKDADALIPLVNKVLVVYKHACVRTCVCLRLCE